MKSAVQFVFYLLVNFGFGLKSGEKPLNLQQQQKKVHEYVIIRRFEWAE